MTQTPLETLDQAQKAADQTMQELKAFWAEQDAAMASVRAKRLAEMTQSSQERAIMRVALGGNSSVDATATDTPITVLSSPTVSFSTQDSGDALRIAEMQRQRDLGLKTPIVIIQVPASSASSTQTSALAVSIPVQNTGLIAKTVKSI